MGEQVIWSIGSSNGCSREFVDNYKQPDLLGNVVYYATNQEKSTQKWPLFHPSEADPDGGYRFYPFTIKFHLSEQPKGDYAFRIYYLVISPRLPYLKINVNGTTGFGYFQPSPSKTTDIALHAGLHTTIYSEGVLEVIIPPQLLRKGENCIELISCDGGDFIHIENIEKIKRLDRMANSAGFIYQYITFSKIDNKGESISSLIIKPSVLYKTTAAGDLVERCHLYIELNKPVPKTTFWLEIKYENEKEKEVIEVPIPETKFGHLHKAFYIKDGTGNVHYKITGRINGEEFTHSGTILRRKKWKVYISPHVHTDIGYTHRQWEVAERLGRNIDTALDILEKEETEKLDIPAFAYHLDASWVLETYLATRRKERIKKFFEYVKAGKIGISHSYVDLLTQYASLEELIRNGEYTESLLRPEGMRSPFTSIVDVPSLSSSLPAIYEGSGVKYVVHASNQDRGPFRLNSGLHKISPFYWEGVNGGKILVWLAKMYCELRKVCGSPPVISSAERGIEMWLDEYETESYRPDAVLLYGQEADNTDLDPQPVQFIKQWNETYAYPKLIACNVIDFFEYIESNFRETLQTVKGDGGAYWEDGVASSIVPSIDIRHAQAMLPAAERLESLAVIHNDGWDYPEQQFDEAWRSTLQYVEHTWGAFLSVTDSKAALQEDQWAVKENFAKNGLQWAKRLLHVAATRHSLSWNNNGREVVVYNPHSWMVSSIVTVEIGRNEKVFDYRSGKEVPMRVIQTTDSQALVALWVENVPGLSYRRMELKPTDTASIYEVAKVQGGTKSANEFPNTNKVTLENKYYRFIVDVTKGYVVSIFDIQLQKELVDTKDEWGFGQFLYAKGGEGTRLVGNQKNLADSNLEVLHHFILLDYNVETFAFGTSLMIKAKVPYGELKVEWQLLDDQKRIDVKFIYEKEERLEKEAVYIAFPLDASLARVLSDSQLGWVDWDKDQLPGGCKEWLPLQTGILIDGRDYDVFIASPDIPLFCVGDIVRGSWPKFQKLSGGRIFSYVLNNYWNTNYKASQGGIIHFRYSITSDHFIAKDQAFRFGWEARLPLYGHRISLQEFRNPSPPYNNLIEGTLAKISSETVTVSTIKKAKWNDGWIIRLQEISGLKQKAKISFPEKKIKEAWEIDLLEKETRKIEVEKDGSLRVTIGPWGLATVRITFE
ncbi:hypothetical protein HT574_09270 [Parageobacillus sp. VR-IP]|uniref:glycosyl hydrolase-related protein n=1 Tax=Parageobacillus sp. VR-IP TaxID=2742205 RepID=UPI00158238AC|nr:glycosyl hydrolase-related protein [Parageobacillus sp. VR-IP]NUK30272.1 hypothetical protein [Parageobacillus sp. VR-IP]